MLKMPRLGSGAIARISWWLLTVVGAPAVACDRVETVSRPASVASGSAGPPTEVFSRAEIVRRSDDLALSGELGQGDEVALKLFEAATLRERIWRLERRQADALEAIELYKNAAKKGSPGLSCGAELQRVMLEGELKTPPSETYRAVYRVRRAFEDPGCRARADQILTRLGAFRPDPRAEAELEAQVARGSSVSSSGPLAPPPGLIVVPKVEALDGDPAVITRIERYAGKTAARIVVFITRPVLFEVGQLAGSDGSGPRLFVDVRGVKYRGPSEFAVEGVVRRVRLGEKKTDTRIVLDLEERVYQRAFYLPEPFRLIVDVSVEPPSDLRPSEDGPRPVQRVVLDPGHGGHDPGAIGAAGLREKDVALDIAHRAAPLIARELKISTLLTRDSDAYIPLDERVARANAFNADLFVSIHCNASENEEHKGVMTFVLDASKDSLASGIAARENSASAQAAAELANAFSRILDAAALARSSHFADLLQRSALASLVPHYGKIHDGGVRRAGFYVLAGARMPAALFEASFISNSTEELRLDTGDYRQKMADAIVNAVRAYRDGH